MRGRTRWILQTIAAVPPIPAARRAVRRCRQIVIRGLGVLTNREPSISLDVRLPVERLGSEYGGWYLATAMLRERCLAYSFGVGTDATFDVALIERLDAEVHGFDPTPISVEWVRSQELPAGFHFQEVGIAGYDGEATFSLPPRHQVSYVIGRDAGDGEVVKAAVRRLATLMAERGHARLDVLKLDVEGAEYAVIEDLVESGLPADHVLVEFHHRADPWTPEDTTRALERLRDAGFLVYRISESGREVSLVNHGALERWRVARSVHADGAE